MTTSPILPEHVGLLLQRVADGVASEKDLETFADLLDRNPALMEEMEAMRATSLMIRDGLLAQAQDVDFRAMQAKVFQAISVPETVSGWERLILGVRAAWQGYRAVLAPLGAAGLAAGLALVVPALTGEPSSVPPGLTASRATDIHTLDTGNTTAVVFQTQASGLTVIWLAGVEADDVDEDQEEPVTQDTAADVPDEVAAELSGDDATATP